MKLSRLLKSLLKTAVYILDQSGAKVERVSDRASDAVAEAKQAVLRHDNHTFRNAISFAAGIGLGVGVGILLAPASGAEVRVSIGEKVQDIDEAIRDQFSTDSKSGTADTEAI